MKITKIKGKDYIEVAERVKEFNKLYPNGQIWTEVSYEGNYVRFKATIYPDVEKLRSFNGHAEEDRTQGNINKTNATENAETSAVGRALGLMGIGIIDSIASADEVTHAIHKQEEPRYEEPFPDHPEPAKPPHEGDNCPRCSVGTLKVRKSAKGQFLGCSAFPNCKHTVNV